MRSLDRDFGPITLLVLYLLTLALNLLSFRGGGAFFSLVLSLNVLTSAVTFLSYLRRDLFHPLSLISLSFLVRLFVPAILILSGISPLPFLGVKWYLGDAWMSGVALAGTALSSLLVGWVIGPARRQITLLGKAKQNSVVSDDIGIIVSACLGMVLGLISLCYFFYINWGVSGSLEVLQMGLLRAGGKPGTSRYSFLGFTLLSYGAWLLGATIFRRSGKVVPALLPSLFVSLLALPFGGRVVAFSYTLMGLAVLWYTSREKFVVHFKANKNIALVLAVLLVICFLLAVPIRSYRGGGVKNVVESLTFIDPTFLWIELNMLYVYSLAVQLGPHSHSLPLLRYLFEGYTGYLLGTMNYMEHGEFLVYRYSEVKTRPGWGPHTGMPVDFFMSFGIWSVVFSMMFMGQLFRLLYSNLVVLNQEGAIWRSMLYVVLFFFLYWTIFERGTGLFTIYERLVFVGLIYVISKLWPKRERRYAICKVR